MTISHPNRQPSASPDRSAAPSPWWWAFSRSRSCRSRPISCCTCSTSTRPGASRCGRPSLNLLALSYRIVYAIVGGYITAMLAPHAPMRHVKIVAVLGLIAGTAGAITAISLADFGPNWYPIALAVTAFHTVWIGGKLH